MNIEKITVQKVFPIAPYMNIKIGVEASIDKEEDVNIAISDAEQILNDWFANTYPDVNKTTLFPSENTVQDVFSGPIPQKKINTHNGKTPVLMSPPPDIRARYEAAEAKGDITTMRNLDKIYNFNP